MNRLLRRWQEELIGAETECLIPDKEEPESHASVEDYEIVDPPQEGEDMELAHGGDDVCRDVLDAPSREEADGEPQPSDESSSSDSDESEDEDEDKADESSSEDYDDESSSDGGDEVEESLSDDYEEDEDEDDAGEYKHQQAFNLESLRRRRLQNAVALILGKVAEDLGGWPVEGDDEWDISAIMERRITHRPLSQCRNSRERDSVVLILDTSGSCLHMSQFFSAIADAAVRAGDVELYTAPNACLEYRKDKHGWQRVSDSHQSYGWERFNRRTIIFFGDFDGGDAPVLASRHNKVYWFSCEDRYSDMDEHSWCSFTLADFRGKYYKCTSEEDFLRLVRKVR